MQGAWSQVLDKLNLDKRFRKGEAPSVGGLASARGLAKMAAVMACKGSFNG